MCNRHEDINKLVAQGVDAVLERASKYKSINYYKNAKPLTPEERVEYDKIHAKFEQKRKELAQRYKLTHKTNERVALACPKCREMYFLSYDSDIYDYDEHVKECIVDCTKCNSFESEERCKDCYMYSMWKEYKERIKR